MKSITEKAALFDELVQALDMSRDYINCELVAERQKFKGYEHASSIPGIEEDLKRVDDLLSRCASSEDGT